MLDTLKIGLTDFDIQPDTCLEVQPATFNAGTCEVGQQYRLWTAGGRTVAGKRAFYNADDYNVTVHPVKEDDLTSILCHVQFSVPKLATGSNYHPADYQTTKTALKTINSELKRIGIKTNLKTATLSRVDSCKTVVAREPYAAYHPVLLSSSVTGAGTRIYGTTFHWGNTQQQLCVYDKIAEMHWKKHKTVGLPSNSIRFEHRLLNTTKVRTATGISTVGDLLTGFDEIEACYKKTMRSKIFHGASSDLEAITQRSLAEQLTRFKGSGSRYFVTDFLVSFAVAQMAGNMETLMKAVETVTDSKTTYRRIKKQLQAAQHEGLELRESNYSRRTLKDLYHELEAAVVGE